MEDRLAWHPQSDQGRPLFMCEGGRGESMAHRNAESTHTHWRPDPKVLRMMKKVLCIKGRRNKTKRPSFLNRLLGDGYGCLLWLWEGEGKGRRNEECPRDKRNYANCCVSREKCAFLIRRVQWINNCRVVTFFSNFVVALFSVHSALS